MAQTLNLRSTQQAAGDCLSPDPFLSANIYCSGRLCEVIHKLVAPFWEAFRSLDPEPTSYLWFLRYAKGGEHLKLRLHGVSSRVRLMRDLLDEFQTAYFAGLDPPGPEARRHYRASATPIDAEDGVSHTDRSFLWTEYRRSHVSLCYEPYLSDATYIALLTRCLGMGSEILLARLKTGSDGRSHHTTRQTLLLHTLMAALSPPIFSPAQRISYLNYHRDVLLRSERKRLSGPHSSRKVEEILARFGREIERLGYRRERLCATAAMYWESSYRTPWGSDLEPWRISVSDLVDYLRSVCDEPTRHIDPFAQCNLFPPLFKALHGFANQAGVDPLNEAFTHHLLLSLATDDASRLQKVQLRLDL